MGASTTKAFTAASVSLLIDDQEAHPGLAWDTPISTLISDDFVLSEDYRTRLITLEDALSHRTGMPRHDLIFGGSDKSTRHVVRNLREVDFTAGLRTTFQYCNIMFTTIGYTIEKLSGQRLGDFMHDHIWKPLNMTSTSLAGLPASNSGKPLAQGYFWDEEDQEHKPLPSASLDQISGAGAIFSTANDYSQWLRMMLNREGPISKQGHAALITPRTIVDTQAEGADEDYLTGDMLYTLGWFKQVY